MVEHGIERLDLLAHEGVGPVEDLLELGFDVEVHQSGSSWSAGRHCGSTTSSDSRSNHTSIG